MSGQDDQFRDAADRSFRKALEDWKNLRAVVQRAAPKLADGFDFEKRRTLPRDFLMPNLRGRECDLLFEVPYRIGDTLRMAIVCILLEQQTRQDPNLILRMLIYAVFYWERQLRAWEAMGKGKGPLKLTPILPIVLASADTSWTTSRTLADLLDEPKAFHAFAPDWNPLFWELGAETPEKLLSDADPFVNLMSLVLSESEPFATLSEIYAKVFEKLDAIPDGESGRWRELAAFAIQWTRHRRPLEERQDWSRTTDECTRRSQRRKEIAKMKKTIAQADYEDGLKFGLDKGVKLGRDEGVKVGVKVGRDEGRIETLREMILRVGSKRLGAPGARWKKRLQDISDASKLDQLCDRVLDIPSWAELFSASS